MDEVILNMYNNYFKLIESTGHCNHIVLNTVILLDFLNELSKDKGALVYLSNDEVEYINKSVDCFINNCLNQ